MSVTQKTLEEAFVGERARTLRQWDQTKPVTAEEIMKIYDIVKQGPTAFNISPLRFAVLDNAEKKEKFVPALQVAPQNIEPMKTAPITLVLAYDPEFHTKLDYLSPGYAPAADYYNSVDEATRVEAAKLNANLQAGYLIAALRIAGYDLGPASGFNPVVANQVLFEPSEKSNKWQSFMYINIGYATADATIWPRMPRFDAATVTADLQ